MKQLQKQISSLLAAGALCTFGLVPAAFAQQLDAQFSLRLQTAQQDTATYQLTLDSASLDPSSVVLKFELAPGISVQQVDAGAGISPSELSHNVNNGRLILLYLDSDGGDSPLHPSSTLAQITLTGVTNATQPPLTCVVREASGVQANDVVKLDAQVTVDTTVSTTDTPATDQTPQQDTPQTSGLSGNDASKQTTQTQEKASVASSSVSLTDKTTSTPKNPLQSTAPSGSNPVSADTSSADKIDPSSSAQFAESNSSSSELATLQPASNAVPAWAFGIGIAALVGAAGLVVYQISQRK